MSIMVRGKGGESRPINDEEKKKPYFIWIEASREFADQWYSNHLKQAFEDIVASKEFDGNMQELESHISSELQKARGKIERAAIDVRKENNFARENFLSLDRDIISVSNALRRVWFSKSQGVKLTQEHSAYSPSENPDAIWQIHRSPENEQGLKENIDRTIRHNEKLGKNSIEKVEFNINFQDRAEPERVLTDLRNMADICLRHRVTTYSQLTPDVLEELNQYAASLDDGGYTSQWSKVNSAVSPRGSMILGAIDLASRSPDRARELALQEQG